MTTPITRARRGPRTSLAQLIGDRLEAPMVEPGAMPDRCAAPCDPSCPNPVHSKGLCEGHAARQRRGKPIDTPLRAGLNRVPLAIRISEDIAKALEDAMSRGEGATVSEVARTVLEDWAEQQTQPKRGKKA